MNKKIITFGENKIEKWKLKNILISGKVSSGQKIYKNFIGYMHDD